MSDNEGQRIEDMRYELGRDAAQKGEQLHNGASEEYRNGYSSYKGFGSNVSPRLFGKGRDMLRDWKCVCGRSNRRYLRRCYDCGLSKFEAARAEEE